MRVTEQRDEARRVTRIVVEVDDRDLHNAGEDKAQLDHLVGEVLSGLADVVTRRATARRSSQSRAIALSGLTE